MDGRPHASALRRGRYSEVGRVYLVTAVTRERTPVFEDFFAARTLVQALRLEEAEQRARTLAYVVMPDHLHWLLQLGEGSMLSTVVGTVKSVTAHGDAHLAAGISRPCAAPRGGPGERCAISGGKSAARRVGEKSG